MTSSSPLTSQFLSRQIPPRPPSPTRRTRPRLPIKSSSSSKDDESRRKNLNLLEFSVTLTLISSSLPAQATAEKKTKKKSSKKKTEALSPEELKSWSTNLPIVGDRIPYTELITLKQSGKLKHIVKLPTVVLKARPDPVLVVLEDSRVLRTVLPSVERDVKFWEEWDRLDLGSACINAYTPPLQKPEVPMPFLRWVWYVPSLIMAKYKRKPKSKRVLELEQERKEMAEQRKEIAAKLQKEREEMEKKLRTRRKMEERKKRLEIRRAKHEQSLRNARRNYKSMANMWDSLARNKNVSTVMGFLIFFVFYQIVVLNYRKQKRDYEDRLKMEKADAEERKRMRALEKEMAGREMEEDEEEGAGKEGEENSYLKVAKQFMQSGAKVRRAHGKRLPQYMERGNDVKFADVAGLGNIRLELEEIVKFFTLGEMYRRRGVKIPG